MDAGLINEFDDMPDNIKDKLTVHEMDAIEAYDWSSINLANYLRGKEFDVGPYGSEEDIDIEELDRIDWQINDLINKSDPLPKGLMLYRGVGGKTGESYESLNVGDVISDSAYSSCSYRPDEAIGFTGLIRGKDKGTLLRIVSSGKEKGLVLGSKNAEIVLGKDIPIKIVQKDTIDLDKNKKILLLTGEVDYD
jgi:hypothetical protein